ncbi:MAG: flagellar hook-associated protein FlgL [Nevskia sp.]|jgi:flagellar hook-associated protein 3 FlgL|nr:flagellar hook-associated protein FlgL [Nevskia sp.]MCK9384132.1 flagellar hook-associated protein FlgL [Nevskia sp.]
MRVSTADFYRQNIDAIQRQQSNVLRVQNQLSSGKKLLTASDDPTGAAHGLSLDQALSANARYTDNTQLATERLGFEENALSAINDSLNSVRERVLQGNGGTLGDSDRQSLAQDLRQSLLQIINYANTPDAEGRYIFAGSNDSAAPFSVAASGTTYTGDDVVRHLQIGPQRFVQTGDSGSDIFLRIKSGNGTFSLAASAANTGTATIASSKLSNAAAYDGGTYTVSFNGGNYQVLDAGNAVVGSGAYTAGDSIQFRGIDLTVTGTPANGDSFTVRPSQQQDLFTTIRNLADLLDTPTASSSTLRAQVQTGVLEGLTSLQTVQDKIIDARAALGARLQSADDSSSQLSAQALQINTALSGLRDIDYAEAAGRLNQQLTGLQAAQQSFAKVQGLTLFNYL